MAIIAANIVAAFAVAFSPALVASLGFSVQKPSIATAFSNLFIHENVLHLLGNMVFMAAVGPAVERVSGSVRLTTVYLLGGLGGVGLFYAIAHRTGDVRPLIGASGAVAACVAYFTVRTWNTRVPLAPRVAIPMVAVSGIWLILQIAGAFINLTVQQGGTAFWAHLGGFAVGLLLTVVFREPQLAMRLEREEAEARVAERSPAATLEIARQRLKRDPNDVPALWILADIAPKLGEIELAVSALVALTDHLPADVLPEPLHRLEIFGALDRLPVHRRTALAEQVKERDPAIAKLLLQSVISGGEHESQLPDALLALASIERVSDPMSAKPLLERLVDKYPLHPATDLARARGWLS